jgi:hypothetical protein
LISYPNPYKRNIGYGVGFGVGAAIVVTLLLYAYLTSYTDQAGIFNRIASFPFAAVAAISLAIASTVLVSNWAKENGESPRTMSGFLGIPSGANNIFAWHPVFMVGGFFFSQVVALTAWSIGDESHHSLKKAIHVLFQLGAAATMIAGLAAIVHHQFLKKSPSLTSMHSWVGVMAISLFGLNMSWGLVMALLTRFNPDSILRKAFDLRLIHKFIGLAAFGLTTVAILTGITDWLPLGSCYYKYDTANTYRADWNPSNNYGALPVACQIANGLGVVVLLAAMAVFIAVGLRTTTMSVAHPEETELQELPQEEAPSSVLEATVIKVEV